MSSRTWVTGVPEMTVLSTPASASELRPSRRAWSWSTRMRTSRVGSTQSKLVRSVSGLAATTLARSSAIERTTDGSGPPTRYCTGQPTGGPSSSGETLAITFGKSSASTCSSLAWRRSREAPPSLAITTACAKNGAASWTSSGR